jgi:hypothetical protein
VRRVRFICFARDGIFVDEATVVHLGECFKGRI